MPVCLHACACMCVFAVPYHFFKRLGMLPTPFSFIWALKMLIGYSIFLINIYLGILVFQLGIFVNFTYQLLPPHLMSVLRSFNKANTIYFLLLL